MSKKVKAAIALFLLIAVAGMGIILYEGGNMTKLHHEIKINTPVEKVWSVLADLEAVQYYNPMVKSARYISSNRRSGAARHCDLKPKGFVREKITEWMPKKAISLELYEHQWPVKFMRWRTELHPQGNDTLVTQDLEYETKFWILGKLMNVLMMRMKMNQGITGAFHELKHYIEAGTK